MNRYKSVIKWSVIFVVVILLWMGFERLVSWHGENIADHAIFTNFFAIFAVGVFAHALPDKRKTASSELMTLKQEDLSEKLPHF